MSKSSPQAHASRATLLALAASACMFLSTAAQTLANQPSSQPHVRSISTPTTSPASRHVIGRASWYGNRFANRPTASGELFDPEKLTGAHRTLPLGTKVVVTNLHNGRSVLVTITDRGPYFPHRDIDLSYGAARVLGMVQRGVARVRIEPLEL